MGKHDQDQIPPQRKGNESERRPETGKHEKK